MNTQIEIKGKKVNTSSKRVIQYTRLWSAQLVSRSASQLRYCAKYLQREQILDRRYA